MNKTFLRLGALALTGMMSISSFAQQITVNGIRYRVLDSAEKTVTVQNLVNYVESSVIIPATVWNGDVEYTVSAIDDRVFEGTNCTEFRVDADLKHIGEHAFANNVEKKNITFTGNFCPEYIGNYAFANTDCVNKNALFLINLTAGGVLDLTGIPATAYNRGAFAGVNLTGINKIMLGYLTSIPEAMFQYTNSDDAFTCELPLTSQLTEVGNSAFQDSGLKVFGYNNSGLYCLPGTLEKVGDYAFSDADQLNYVTDAEVMKFSAFDTDSKITYVGKYAFDGWSKLTNARFENLFGSFADLDYAEGSFKDCGLTYVDLSEAKVKDVPDEAFLGNPLNGNNLELTYGEDILMTSIILNPACESIGNEAFHVSSTGSVGNIDIPATVQSIGYNAFEGRSADNVFIRVDQPFDQVSLPTYTKLWIPSKEGVLPAFMAAAADKTSQWYKLKFTQFLPEYNDGIISYTGIQSKGDLSYKASKYVVPAATESANVTILDKFTCEPQSKYGYGFEGGNVTEITPTIFSNLKDAAKAQIASITYETAEITTVPVMNNLPNLTKVALPSQIETLPTGVFQVDAALTDVNLAETDVKALPAYAFDGAEALQTIDLSKITAFGDYAFQNCVALANVEFNEGTTSVGQYAFKGTALSEINLPATLATIGVYAFNTATLNDVYVNYDGNGTVPAIASTVFYKAKGSALFQAKLHTNGLDRAYYLTKGSWKLFIPGNASTIKVDDVRIAANEEGVYILNDGAEHVSISTNVDVDAVYNRHFGLGGIWQCWYVPFDIDLGSEDLPEGVKFAKLYDTKLDAKDDTRIEFKEVTGGTIHANLPYLVKVESAGDYTFKAETLYATPEEATPITVTNAENTYTFEGTYDQMKGAAEPSWYGIITTAEGEDSYLNGSFAPANEEAYINAYRFYMTVKSKKNPYSSVKFVVLGDDEDATGISNINAEGLSTPMFDLMGRQIAAPVKGQVYIQNGVKKLAR